MRWSAGSGSSKIEREAVKKEQDPASAERLRKIERDIGTLGKAERAQGQWQAEKGGIQEIRSIKEQIEQARIEAEKAEREGNLGRAAELRYGKLPELQKRLDADSSRLATIQSQQKMLKEEVDEEDVAEIVSTWTGIPVSRMMEGEVQKLIHMEERLRRRVVGQDRPSGRLQRRAPGARRHPDPNRPIGSFIFMGPHGRGQDRACPGPGGVPLRRRAGHDPHRHVGISGAAHRFPAHRRASGIRGLRGGRTAHGSSAQAPLFGHPF